MKKKVQLALAASVLVLAIMACSIGSSTPTPVPPTPIPPTPIPTTGTLTVVNNTGDTIFYLYVSPSTSSTWGDDVLGASVLSAGESFTLSDIEPGTYDLMAEDSSHTTIETWMGVDIRGPVTWTVAGSGGGGGGGGTGTASLTIINNSGVTIFYAYVSPSTSTTWGDDVLGSSVISAGESFTLTGIPEGTYDLKAEDSDHNVIETQMGISLSGEMEWTVTGTGGGGGGTGEGSSLNIINNSGRDIYYLYIVPQNSASWGDDQLGSDIIPTGSSYEIWGIPPGMYDVRVVDSNNTNIAIFNAVNLNGDFTLTVNAP